MLRTADYTLHTNPRELWGWRGYGQGRAFIVEIFTVVEGVSVLQQGPRLQEEQGCALTLLTL